MKPYSNPICYLTSLAYLACFIFMLIALPACQPSNEQDTNKPGSSTSSTSQKTPLVKTPSVKAPQLDMPLDINAFLEIDGTNLISFKIKKDKGADHLSIINGEEAIKVSDFKQTERELEFTMPVFNSLIKTRLVDGNLLGEWHKFPNKEDYKMPMYGFSNKKMNIIPPRFTDYDMQMAAGDGPDANITGTWEVQFSPDTEDEYPAIGEFKQQGNDVQGTFITETGDYRFLAGKIYGQQFYLSCFDGAHAFLFKGTIDKQGGGQITGTFWSGKNWKEPWIAKHNKEAKLGDPYKLTYLKEGAEVFDFSFSDLNGKTITKNDDAFQGKNLVVQIFGSWCPNCMDETKFYTDLYKEYKDKDIEFIGVAFERGGELAKDRETLEKYIEHFNIPYPILYGGKASKKLASEKFPMLNKVISFPTTIIVNKVGEVVKIHTGFNGPATSVHNDYVASFKKTLDNLN